MFRFSSLVYGLCANLCFSSTRVAWWLINKSTNQLINKNVIFLLSSLHFCLPFGFVFIRMSSWESWNSRILCIKKQTIWTQTINKWRISKRSVVLLRRQLNQLMSWQRRNQFVLGCKQYNYIRFHFVGTFTMVMGFWRKTIFGFVCWYRNSWHWTLSSVS